jgi:hypothetical protein
MERFITLQVTDDPEDPSRLNEKEQIWAGPRDSATSSYPFLHWATSVQVAINQPGATLG